MKRKLISVILTLVLALSLCLVTAVPVAAADPTTIASSTMVFEGKLRVDGEGYSGTIFMVGGAGEVAAGVAGGEDGFDNYARDGATARFLDDRGLVGPDLIIAGHDAYPGEGIPGGWNPDVPDWNCYALTLVGNSWRLVYNNSNTPPADWAVRGGVPMSGTMDWNNGYAAETDFGYCFGNPVNVGPVEPAYIGWAANNGGGAACWDMDWLWGGEVVPLAFPGFAVDILDLGDDNFRVIMTPAMGDDPPGPVVNEDTGESFGAIQDSIDAPETDANDTISVEAGTYNECLAVNKSVNIIGAGVSEVTINTCGLAVNNAGIYVSVDDVLLQGFTQVGNPDAALPRYGIKFADVSGGSVMEVLARDNYRTGFDFLGTMSTTVSNIESRDNGGHGIQLCDSTDIALSGITVSGNGWEGVSVATYGRHTPLGTSGIVFSGTNSFGDVFQLEEGDYNNINNLPPVGEAIITYSTDIGDGADVTVQVSDFGYALHGDQDDGPDQNRIWFFKTLAEAEAVLLPPPTGFSHFKGDGIYVEDLATLSHLYGYRPLPNNWSIVSPDKAWSSWGTLGDELVYAYDLGFSTPEQGSSILPLNALYVKTDGGGWMKFSYPENDLGMYAINLEAGWNLVGVPETEASTRAILSPLRFGANNEVALATLASQGDYNHSGESFYLATISPSDWGEGMPNGDGPGLGGVTLNPFDGYWAYMNVAKEFGVVVVK